MEANMANWNVSAAGTRDGKPAIEFWRHGVAAKGEARIVTQVQAFPDTETRDAALFSKRK